MEILNNVFVYGTLMKGEKNHDILNGSRFITDGITLNQYSMFDTGLFPIVTNECEIYSIKGEIYRVSDSLLKDIDIIENPVFRRAEVPIIGYYTGVITAWMYLVEDSEHYPFIYCGSWKDRHKRV